MRRLALVHRWLGTATCLLFFMWYASGIVMTYAEMPALTPDEREAALPALEIEQVRLSPAEAVARAALDVPPASVRLTSLFGRPVYRLHGARALTVFADDGRVADHFSFQEATASLVPYLIPSATPWHLESVSSEPDQWTLSGQYRNARPLFRVRVEDAARTVLYVSGVTGDVVLRTTRRTRALAWAGAIPHWLYLTALRRHAELWRFTVLGVSLVSSLVCLLGLILGLRHHLRRERPAFRGALFWHLWLGTAAGGMTLVWVTSGAMTLDPVPFLSGPGGARRSDASSDRMSWESFSLSARELERAASGAAIKEVEFVEVAGQPYYRVVVSGSQDLFLDRAGQPAAAFGESFLLAAAGRAMGNAVPARSLVLDEYDSYYHDRAARRPLPVLRVEFGDSDSTWLYMDPARGQLVARVDRAARWNRWLSDGLHRLDLPFLPRGRWHAALVALLCVGGGALSATAVVLSFERLRR